MLRLRAIKDGGARILVNSLLRRAAFACAVAAVVERNQAETGMAQRMEIIHARGEIAAIAVKKYERWESGAGGMAPDMHMRAVAVLKRYIGKIRQPIGLRRFHWVEGEGMIQHLALQRAGGNA